MLTRDGTLGRVYGGDPNLIHIADGKREGAAAQLAFELDRLMRQHAENRTADEKERQPLCPGCYMVVGFDMMLILAEQNGQCKRELARTMRDAWQMVLDNPEQDCVEEILILIDPE